MEENWYALMIAILLKQPPERSFQILFEGKKRVTGPSAFTDEDTIDMIKLKEQGCTYREIGEMYGISEGATCKRMQYYKKHKKDRSMEKRQYNIKLTNQLYYNTN